jgi:signal transduction histidine kinase
MTNVRLRNLKLVGFLTWAIIGVPTVMVELKHYGAFTPRGWAWLGCYLAFGLFFGLTSRSGRHGPVETFYLLLQSVVALACLFLEPKGLSAVLLVIVAAEAGTRSPRVAVTWVLVQSLVMSFAFRNDSMAVEIALAYVAFQLFAVFALHTAHSEAHARQALAEVHAELKVTAGLLDINSRTSERLRIAREVHDLLGHHLTALSLNLEVASHQATGPALESIEKSKAITKLLLSDVRDVVSRMREDEPVDLAAALQSLREVITTPLLHLDLQGDLAVTDATVAQVALRAVQEIVTNAVRHSGARNLRLRLANGGGRLAIEANDDGAGTDAVHFGNGLRGIRERVEQVGGSLEVSSLRGRGFTVRVSLPLRVAA